MTSALPRLPAAMPRGPKHGTNSAHVLYLLSDYTLPLYAPTLFYHSPTNTNTNTNTNTTTTSSTSNPIEREIKKKE